MTSSRAGRRPEKGRRYHELLEALDERGCPVCRLAEESVEDAISAILHEQVNDAAFREQFLASGGFCRHHAWRFVLQHDILGTAILYRALLRDAGRHRRVAAHCQLCLSYESGEGSALDILEYGLDEATFADKFAQSDGLCDPHFEMALRHLGDRGALRQLQGETRRRLLYQLDELIRKQDYRFVGEPNEGEGDSWLRAVNAAAGIDAQALPRRRSRKLPPSKSESARQNERA